MILAYLFIVVAAILNTAQSGSSATLHKQMNHPILPGIVTCVTRMTALLIALVVYGWFRKRHCRVWSSGTGWLLPARGGCGSVEF